jgi:hypothetical protein
VKKGGAGLNSLYGISHGLAVTNTTLKPSVGREIEAEERSIGCYEICERRKKKKRS